MSHHIHKLTAFKRDIADVPGALAQVTADLAGCGVNLKAAWGWNESEGKAVAMFLPEDPAQVTACGCPTCSAASPLSVLWIEDSDEIGGLNAYLQKIGAAGINLEAVQALGVGGKFGVVLMFADEAALDAALQAVGGGCCSGG